MTEYATVILRTDTETFVGEYPVEQAIALVDEMARVEGIRAELFDCTCHVWPECAAPACTCHDPLDPPGEDCRPLWPTVPRCPYHVGPLARLLTDDDDDGGES